METKIFRYSLLTIALGAFALSACTEGDKFDYHKNLAYMTGTETSPLVKFVVEDTPATYPVTVSLADKVSEDVTVKLSMDNTLIDQYNKENKTSYYPVPASAIKAGNMDVVIKAGRASSTSADVSIISTDEFIDGRVYVIPVTIKEIGGGLDALKPSETIFLRISRVINFNSLDISNTNMYSNYIAPDALAVNLPNYTYEIKCYINAWHETPERISRLCSFTAKDESNSNMLRFGENGQDLNSLQWVSPIGSIVSTTRFTPGRWYTISLTHDGSKFTMYVDGVKDCEMQGSANCTFQRFEMGMSWENYPAKQYFNGRIAEARVWNRALTTGELQLGICGVDVATEGLIAYWKFDEGTGSIFKDATKHGYDMDWSKTFRDTGNGVLSPFDKSSYVKWIFDEKNKCNQ